MNKHHFLSLIIALSLFFSFSQPAEASTTFKDVNYQSGIGKSIQWGTDQGLLAGYGNGTFKPHQPMTEGQFLRVLSRYAYGFPSYFSEAERYSIIIETTNHTLPGFKEAKKRSQYIARIEVAKNLYALAHPNQQQLPSDSIIIDWMYDKGITHGKGQFPQDRYKDFGSEDQLTRGQVTAFFHRFDQQVGNDSQRSDTIAGLKLEMKRPTSTTSYLKNQRKVMNEQQLEWNVHHKDYRELFSWSEKDGEIVSLFTTHPALYIHSKGVKIGMTKKEVEKRIGAPTRTFEGKRTVYENESSYTTYFYDFLNQDKLTGVLIHSKQLPNYHSLKYAPVSQKYARDNELFAFDLLNNTRVEANLHPLKWNASVATMARRHSEDMVKHNYFSHTSLAGQTYKNRLQAHGIQISYASENISSGYVSPIFSHNGLINSKNHRSNVFCPVVQEVGIGIAYNEKMIPKYTHNYVKLKKKSR